MPESALTPAPVKITSRGKSRRNPLRACMSCASISTAAVYAASVAGDRLICISSLTYTGIRSVERAPFQLTRRRSMQLLISGGTGFIGSALVQALTHQGHEVIVLTRQAPGSRDGVRFIQSLDTIEANEPIDAIVNLAGASLAAKRWSGAYKRELLSSRIDTTRDILALIRRLQCTPQTLLSASAIGYYGHHGDAKLAEDAGSNPCFSQQLCQAWEAQAMEASAGGTRVCLTRFGVVLDAGGGALTEMTRSFRLGVGSWAGSGSQWMSWVHRADVVRALQFLLERDDIA